MTRKKVMLVDDSKTSLFMAQMILRREAAFDVVTAGDGAEAIEKALSEQPDLILMDVVMPRMDGIEALRQLRLHERTKAIPVIMVTTRGEGPNVEVAFECGCTDYVTKPIDPLELLAKVRGCLVH
jgi:CheY-like chemotaxis protein